jgi:hypothetical protein
VHHLRRPDDDKGSRLGGSDRSRPSHRSAGASRHRIGLVDTRDALSIVGILTAFIAGRSAALLPVSGVNDPEMQDFASDARCAAVLVGGLLESVTRPSPDDPLGLLDPEPAGVGDAGTGSTSTPRDTRPEDGSNLSENALNTPRSRRRRGSGCRPVAVRIERTRAEARATGSGTAGVTSTVAAGRSRAVTFWWLSVHQLSPSSSLTSGDVVDGARRMSSFSGGTCSRTVRTGRPLSPSWPTPPSHHDSDGSPPSCSIDPEQTRRLVQLLASDRGRRLLTNGARRRRPAPALGRGVPEAQEQVRLIRAGARTWSPGRRPARP